MKQIRIAKLLVVPVLRWLIIGIMDISLTILGYFLAPVLPAFAIGKDHLPKWLAAFDTPDNPLDGDEGFLKHHALFKGEVNAVERYLNRVWWLLRNPGYGFSYDNLGAVITATPTLLSGNLFVSDRPDLTIRRNVGLSGHALLLSADGKYFEWYLVKQYGSSGCCFRVRWGYKMIGFVNHPDVFKIGQKAQFASLTSIKPLASFTNKPAF